MNWKEETAKAEVQKTLLLGFLALALCATAGFAAVNITADVSESAPVIGEIQVCDTTCAYHKSVDPASAITVRVVVGDDNNNFNWDSCVLEIYQTADANGATADWEHITLAAPLTFAAGDGCTQDDNGSTDVNCITVLATDWTTKMATGDKNVFVRCQDFNGRWDANSGAMASVNSTTGIAQAATTGIWSGVAANTTNNAVVADSNAYIHTVHNGNVNLDVTCTATNLTAGAYTLGYANMHWDVAGTPPGAAYTGGADAIQATWGKGTDPTPASIDHYNWIDIPLGTASGHYTGTFTYASAAS